MHGCITKCSVENMYKKYTTSDCHYIVNKRTICQKPHLNQLSMVKNQSTASNAIRMSTLNLVHENKIMIQKSLQNKWRILFKSS